MKKFLLVTIALASLPASAYIGPGVGAGAIASVLGLLGALVLAIFGILYYPIKRFFKNRKRQSPGE